MTDQCEFVLSLLLPVASCTGRKRQRGELIPIQRRIPAAASAVHAAARWMERPSGAKDQPTAVLSQNTPQPGGERLHRVISTITAMYDFKTWKVLENEGNQLPPAVLHDSLNRM